MSDYLQRIHELSKKPTELRFEEVQAILFQFGYLLSNSKGSHFSFKKEDFPTIRIVVHNNKVKKWYVKDMCKVLTNQLPFSYEK